MPEKGNCKRCGKEVEGNARGILYLQTGTFTNYEYECGCGHRGFYKVQGEDQGLVRNSGLLTI